MTRRRAYELLGLPDTASAGEISRTYKRLVFRHHPDHADDRVDSHARFCELTAAYSLLKKLHARDRGTSRFDTCESCGEFRSLRRGLAGQKKCDVCLLAARSRRLPMTWETTRCFLVIGLECFAAICLLLAIRGHGLEIAFAGLVALAAASLALTRDVVNSVVVTRPARRRWRHQRASS